MLFELSPRQIQRLVSLANSSVRVHHPSMSLWPFLSKPVGPWTLDSQPGVVSKVRSDVAKWSKLNRDKVGRKIETHYLSRFFPRNFKNGDVMWDVLHNIQYSVNTPSAATVEDVIEVLVLLGIKRQSINIRNAIAAVQPTRTQASAGITYLPDRDYLCMGKKGSKWWTFINSALKLFDYLEGKYGSLTFDQIVALKDQIISELKLVFVAFARWDDSGPHNPRLIWAGNTLIYILESALFSSFSTQLHNSPYITFKESDMWSYLNTFPGPYVMLDLSKFDRHFSDRFQEILWKSLTIYMDWPEWLTAVLFVYNAYAPLVRPTVDTEFNDWFFLQPRNGIQPSGSGSFVYTNILGNHVIQHLILKLLGTFGLGHLYGDNTVVSLAGTSIETLPAKRVVAIWSALTSTVFGFKMKLPESVVGTNNVVQVRRIFNIRDGIVEPVLASRVRNLLCPRALNPESLSPAEVAVRLRSQMIEIMHANLINTAYKSILERLTNLGFTDRLLPDLSDDELATYLPPGDSGWNSYKRVLEFRTFGDFSEMLTQLT